MKRWLRRVFINWLIHDLFKAVDARDILIVQGPSVAFFNGKQIPAETLERLISDAQRFENSMLWQVLSRQIRYKASDLLAYSSKTPEDMVAGKMLLYALQVIEEVLSDLRKS